MSHPRQYWITLRSDDPGARRVGGSHTHLRARLGQQYHLPGESQEWEVALQSISFTTDDALESADVAIYSDLVGGTIEGTQTVPLLRNLIGVSHYPSAQPPAEKHTFVEDGSLVPWKPLKPSKTSFSEVEIQLATIAGAPIPSSTFATTVTILIRHVSMR